VGTRRPPFPTPPGSISHRLIAILPDSFEVRSPEGAPSVSQKLFWQVCLKQSLVGPSSTEGLLVSGLLCIALLLVVHVLLVYISLLGDGD
jgi:hypothetical protein